MNKISNKVLILCAVLFTLFQINAFAEDNTDVFYPEPTPSILYNWDGGIEIIPPTKTEYIEGEYLDITGMEAYGTSGIYYDDGTNVITNRDKLTSVTVDLLDKPLTVEDTTVTVTGYYWITGSVPIDGTFKITVKPKSGGSQTVYSYELNELSLSTISGEGTNAPPQNFSFIVDVAVTKTQERNAKDFVFVAVYDTDGALLSLDYVKADFPLNTKCSFGFNVPAQEKQVGSIKAYVWEDFNSPEPLAESKTLTFE